MTIPPKKASARKEVADKDLLSKVINAKNEETSTAKAANAVDKLHVVSPIAIIPRSIVAFLYVLLSLAADVSLAEH